MAAILLHISDMLGGGSCNGVKVLVEHCLQKKLKRKSEKYHTYFMLDIALRQYMLKYHKL